MDSSWVHDTKWWLPPSVHGCCPVEPDREDKRVRRSLYWVVSLWLMQTLVSSVFLPLPSIDPPEGGEWRPEQQDPEDHWFWPGSGMASNYQDECSRDLCLDGPWSHSCLHVFQRQWRVEVRSRGSESVFPRPILATHMPQDLESWGCLESQVPQVGLSDPSRAIYTNL